MPVLLLIWRKRLEELHMRPMSAAVPRPDATRTTHVLARDILDSNEPRVGLVAVVNDALSQFRLGAVVVDAAAEVVRGDD